MRKEEWWGRGSLGRKEGRGLVRVFLEAGAGGLGTLLPGCHSTAGCRTDTKDEVWVRPH